MAIWSQVTPAGVPRMLMALSGRPLSISFESIRAFCLLTYAARSSPPSAYTATAFLSWGFCGSRTRRTGLPGLKSPRRPAFLWYLSPRSCDTKIPTGGSRRSVGPTRRPVESSQSRRTTSPELSRYSIKCTPGNPPSAPAKRTGLPSGFAYQDGCEPWSGPAAGWLRYRAVVEPSSHSISPISGGYCGQSEGADTHSARRPPHLARAGPAPRAAGRLVPPLSR